ncbi:pseudoazurin [Caulobacter sp.]|uniref:pseudoazurin n=1 Tax=Caulobacter sp. TaxID=78 RepID=UPI00160B9D3C
MLKSVLALGAIAGVLTFANVAGAAELKVKMLNRGAEGMMVFEPSSAKLKPGDTIRFIPTDPGHDVASIPGMAPPGFTPVKGALNKEVVVTLAKSGVYGFKCTPHWGMGMVFVAKVGDGKPNAAAAEASVATTPGLVKKRLTAAFNAIR